MANKLVLAIIVILLIDCSIAFGAGDKANYPDRMLGAPLSSTPCGGPDGVFTGPTPQSYGLKQILEPASIRAKLEAVSINKELLDRAVELSTHPEVHTGVFRVRPNTPSETEFVLRVAIASFEEAYYAQWVADLAQTAPVLISPVRIIQGTPEMHAAIATKLKEHRNFRGNLSLFRKGRPYQPFLMTLSLFLPGHSGTDFLNDQFASHTRLQWRHEAIHLNRMSLAHDALDTVIETAFDTVDKMNPAHLRQLAEDFANLGLGSLDELVNLSEKGLFYKFMRAATASDRDWSALSNELVLNRLSPVIRQRISDLWAFCYVVAIHDLHSSNWLIWHDWIMGLDLNIAARALYDGGVKVTDISPLLGPLLNPPQDEKVTMQTMIRELSPMMIQWLARVALGKNPFVSGNVEPNVTPSKSHIFEIKPIMERGMRLRAATVLNTLPETHLREVIGQQSVINQLRARLSNQ